MGRPASDLDDYLEWQERLENQKASGLSVEFGAPGLGPGYWRGHSRQGEGRRMR